MIERNPNRLTKPERHALIWMLSILLIQLLCQIALMFQTFSSFRFIFRSAAFLASIVGLTFIYFRHGKSHPSELYGIGIIGLLALNMFHPTTNSPLAGIAAIGLNTAILAPLFWISRLEITPKVFYFYITGNWTWYNLSAFVAVLQVYYPGSFQPAVSTTVQSMGAFADGLKIQLADGTQVWRPMGLTDMPGGAASAGIYAFLFGLGFLVNSRNRIVQGLALMGLFNGLFCVYICQFRSSLVMVGIAALVFVSLLSIRGQMSKAAGLWIAIPLAFIVSFGWAVMVGGEQVSNRYQTLVDQDTSTVYYSNRGLFLEQTWNETIPQYPMGAGLGRWGMVFAYFADYTNVDSPPIYVEIQLTAWVLDGGILLALLYYAAIFTAMAALIRIVYKSKNHQIVSWAALIFAYDLSAFAVTFNYPLFISQGGMEFWLLNTAIYTAAYQRLGSRRPKPAQKRPRIPLRPLPDKAIVPNGHHSVASL